VFDVADSFSPETSASHSAFADLPLTKEEGNVMLGAHSLPSKESKEFDVAVSLSPDASASCNDTANPPLLKEEVNVVEGACSPPSKDVKEFDVAGSLPPDASANRSALADLSLTKEEGSVMVTAASTTCKDTNVPGVEGSFLPEMPASSSASDEMNAGADKSGDSPKLPDDDRWIDTSWDGWLNLQELLVITNDLDFNPEEIRCVFQVWKERGLTNEQDEVDSCEFLSFISRDPPFSVEELEAELLDEILHDRYESDEDITLVELGRTESDEDITPVGLFEVVHNGPDGSLKCLICERSLPTLVRFSNASLDEGIFCRDCSEEFFTCRTCHNIQALDSEG
jgi:hypothetical protein